MYHWIDESQSIDRRGSIQLEGVELVNMGKRDQDKAGITLFQTNSPGDTSAVRDSSIHDS